MATNNCSRQSAMPLPGVGTMCSRLRKNDVLSSSEFESGSAAALQRGGQVGHIHVTIEHLDAVEALLHGFDLDVLFVRYVGNFPEDHRQQHHPAVQHLVVGEVVQQRVGHTVRIGHEEDRGVGYPRDALGRRWNREKAPAESGSCAGAREQDAASAFPGVVMTTKMATPMTSGKPPALRDLERVGSEKKRCRSPGRSRWPARRPPSCSPRRNAPRRR